jgi:hypothetical protein
MSDSTSADGKTVPGLKTCKTCKTCKHWSPSEEYEAGHSQGLGRCQAVPQLWDATEWRDDADYRVFKAEFINVTAFAKDGSDYSAHLYTRPQHGCTMHSAGEPV